MLGTYVLSAGYYDAYYLKAQQVRTLIRRDYEHAFERVDVVAMPTSPTPAFRLGETRRRPAADVSGGRVHRQREPRGLPAISVPCGFTRHGLPIGLQLDRPARSTRPTAGRRRRLRARHRMVEGGLHAITEWVTQPAFATGLTLHGRRHR